MTLKISFAILIIYVLAALNISCKENKKEQNNGITQIEWKNKFWDFGELQEGEEVCHTFYFTNTGKQSLIIKKVETGCGCTTVTYDKAPVLPGKEGKIEIAFNSRGRYGKQYKEISIFANIPKKISKLSISGNIKY